VFHWKLNTGGIIMEINICGVTFKKVDDYTIAIYQGDEFYKYIYLPAKTEEEFHASTNHYFVHCW
jgi:hypothetical protein